ncbi:hypothetical protein TWF481_006388 [Arthrobotrys musiformis]|uniref:F-box domain-containing protein n=1 Tax=Arthrobotrys musiformis TaxID=47236 RepID=A0AAV9WGQ7_9PEZI
MDRPTDPTPSNQPTEGLETKSLKSEGLLTDSGPKIDKKGFPFDKLPIELQTEILSYCPRDELLEVSKTCRAFRMVCLRFYMREAHVRTSVEGGCLKLLERYEELRSAVKYLKVDIFRRPAKETWDQLMKDNFYDLRYWSRDWIDCTPDTPFNIIGYLRDFDCQGSIPVEECHLDPVFSGICPFKDVRASFNHPKIFEAFSKGFFQRAVHIDIDTICTNIKSFIPFIKLLSKFQPAGLQTLNIRVASPGGPLITMVPEDQLDLHFPRGLKSMTYLAGSFLKGFEGLTTTMSSNAHSTLSPFWKPTPLSGVHLERGRIYQT